MPEPALSGGKMQNYVVIGQMGGVEGRAGCHFGLDPGFAAGEQPSGNAKQTGRVSAQQNTESVVEGIRLDQSAVQIHAERDCRSDGSGLSSGSVFDRILKRGFHSFLGLLELGA
jgi:hypothetical protein